MPYEDLIVGSKVRLGEKEGTVIEHGDQYKVKWDEGSFSFHDGNEITPIVPVSSLKARIKKEESQEMPDEVFMQPTATGEDPLAQPVNDTDRGVGEPQNVLGKKASVDKFGQDLNNKKNKEDINMKKKKVLGEEVDEPVDKKVDDEEEDNVSKQSEDEEKPKEDVEKQEGEEEDEEEKKKKKAKKKKKKMEDEDEMEKQEEEEDVEKQEGEDPEESAEESQKPDSTISPNASVPSQAQNVLVPPSSVNVPRQQETPMDGDPLGKSVNPDLLKSPLFVNLSNQMDGIKDAMSKKLDAVEKSVNDRLSNVQKDMKKIEKFYNQSFYKAISENVSPEGTQHQPISKQLADGKVQFRN